MACSHCNRETSAKPKDGCASLSHWQIWAGRLLKAVEEADAPLYDNAPMDLEHTIDCHPNEVVPLLRLMGAAYQKAHDTLQEVISDTVEWPPETDPR